MPQQMAASPERNSISVVDVYDIAASVGKEFEKIIDTHGPEAVTDLMPKVITILEQLEDLASRNQQENVEISELKFTVERLQAEKAAKAEERGKYEQELLQIEESWQSETKELLGSITQLQDENRRLRSSLQVQEGVQAETEKAAEEEISIIHQLQQTVCDQRNQTRSLQREVSQKNMDLDAMRHEVDKLKQLTSTLHDYDKKWEKQMGSQIERLTKLNTRYRQKQTLTQQRAQNLIQEKVDLQAQLHDKEQQITHIKDRIREDSVDSPDTPKLTDEEWTQLQQRLEKEGKMVIDVVDMQDPDRPRFTLNELRDVLQERNELKTKLLEVEDELQQYKPPEPAPADFDFDAPVYGPINKEPDEKLFPGRREDSGIRKFLESRFQRFREILATGIESEED